MLQVVEGGKRPQRRARVGARATEARAGWDAFVQREGGGKSALCRGLEGGLRFEHAVVAALRNLEASDGQLGFRGGLHLEQVVQLDRLHMAPELVHAIGQSPQDRKIQVQLRSRRQRDDH